MADIVSGITSPGATVYFHIRNSAGNVYNGATFEAYSAGNYADYDIAMTEQGSTGVYIGTFPALSAGRYLVTMFAQAGGSPAEGDTPIANGDGWWDGSEFLDLSGLFAYGDSNWAGETKEDIAAEILATPANKLVTNDSGQVEVSNDTDIANSVWATETRTLSSFGTLVSDIASATATAVWAAGTRTLTSLGTLIADVWAYASRTLTAFAFTPTPSNAADTTAIKAKTDQLTFTTPNQVDANALTSVGGDATASNQTDILAAIAALNDISATDVATVLMATTVDGSATVEDVLTNLLSMAFGKVVRTATDPVTLEFMHKTAQPY